MSRKADSNNMAAALAVLADMLRLFKQCNTKFSVLCNTNALYACVSFASRQRISVSLDHMYCTGKDCTGKPETPYANDVRLHLSDGQWVPDM
jgi:hypothetical protein